MSKLLNVKTLVEQRKSVIDKWKDTGLLDDSLKDNKTSMASLLECKATGLLTEGDCCDNCKKNTENSV
jgi:hypothetical protein|tara:strand:- start:20570 stop:20773 length:204 start_codon:yes stop_codon:yes gene_type:complete